MTIIQKRQVVKEILETGQNLGKPGRPFIVTVQVQGYFAKPETEEERKAKLKENKEKNRREVRIMKKVKKRGKRKKKKTTALSGLKKTSFAEDAGEEVVSEYESYEETLSEEEEGEEK